MVVCTRGVLANTTGLKELKEIAKIPAVSTIVCFDDIKEPMMRRDVAEVLECKDKECICEVLLFGKSVGLLVG